MFEGMLARRFITAQKRHSALTVCSIAIALALIIMLFSLFSTVMSSLRSIAYDKGAYHVSVTGPFGFNKEDYDVFAEALSKYAGDYATCTYREGYVADGIAWDKADIIFIKYIDDYADAFIEKIGAKLGSKYEHLICDTNDLLMMCDMVDLRSAMKMAGVVAVFYVFVLFLVFVLRLIIDTAFEISSKERERQFGVLQSIGATPKQIVHIITYEGLMLSAVGIPLGVGAGIGLGYLAYRAVLSTHVAEFYISPSKAGELIHFTLNPWLLLLGIVTGAAWVFFSAYGTGMRVVKMSPVQAISQRSNTVKKTGRSPLFGKLFGWAGKIASRNNLRQPKRFIATVVSLTLSIALFSSVNVITNDLRSAVEEEIDYFRDFDGDFSVSAYSTNDPLIACKQMDILEESGFFGELMFDHWIDGNYDDDIKINSSDSRVYYYSKDAYQKLFGGDPPVSYDELAQSGGYIFKGTAADADDAPEKVTLWFGQDREITEREYNNLLDEELKFVEINEVDGETTYRYNNRYRAEFDVFLTLRHSDPSRCSLIGTLDQYENGEYKKFEKEYRTYTGLECYLADEDDYFDALSFMESNFNDENINNGYVSYYDVGSEMRKARAMLASVKIGASFFSILIALIAVVNMVNILATGILNRRSELASMQCVGMTEKQLYNMTAVECLQYALTSGIAAVAVCELMMFFTDKILHLVGELLEVLHLFVNMEFIINYIQPLPMIGIATLCAFVIAVAASIFPLRAMRKTSLVEQIRSVE